METPYLVRESPTSGLFDTWVQVLVDAPGARRVYTYRVAAGMVVAGGDVVCVPFGSQKIGGIVLERLDTLPPSLVADQVKAVEEVLGAGFFPPGYWQLLEQVAHYYLTPLARVLETALPPGLLARSQRRIRLTAITNPLLEWTLSPSTRAMLEFVRAHKADVSWRFLKQRLPHAQHSLTELLNRGLAESYLADPDPPRPLVRQVVVLVERECEGLTPRQYEVLQSLGRLGGEMAVERFLTEARTTRTLIATLQKLGRVIVCERQVLRSSEAEAVYRDTPKTLTPEQQVALDQLHAAPAGPVLLHGITGSGKTEVYLQAIAPVLARGQSALVLVPEIGLTPQLTDRFRARFGPQVRVYHSALSDGERYDSWRQMLTGEPQIVIGTRSAVFAPLPHLGLIVLDEEHDGSYKQDRPAPCYHARTVAVWRAQAHQCPLILGSATPDLETYMQASRGDILHLKLTERVAGRPLPVVDVVDLREELRQGNLTPFSRTLQRAIGTMLDHKHQGILFINRRGYSTFVLCRNCGESLRCPHCTVSLTYHRLATGEHLRCHYCNHGCAQPRCCPHCRSPHLRYFGSGTQRITAELGELFPHLRILRFDRDTTSRKGSHRQILEQFANGEADVLVGTQMLTKGIDLPHVTLVGILAADGLLNLPDFRSGERAFQLLTQVAGRAGRAEEPGRVILQTYAPEHPIVEAASRHHYLDFTLAELEQRQVFGLPPFNQLIALHLSGQDETRVISTAEALASSIDACSDFTGQLLGPAPCAIVRVANRYRWQLLVKNRYAERGRNQLRETLSGFTCPPQVSLAVDIDPLRLL